MPPVFEQLARRGAPFIGVLFAGLMLTETGPQVLEFNCRLGDPEAQTILAAHDDDLLPALAAAAAGNAAGFSAPVDGRAAVTVVVTAGSYPESGDTGSPIDGVAAAEETGALVFHAGTARRGGALVTNGGRIVAVTGRGDSVADARSQAYAGAERISFAGARYRRDIASG
jgi:phosphoribosylamine--glycine ligase